MAAFSDIVHPNDVVSITTRVRSTTPLRCSSSSDEEPLLPDMELSSFGAKKGPSNNQDSPRGGGCCLVFSIESFAIHFQQEEVPRQSGTFRRWQALGASWSTSKPFNTKTNTGEGIFMPPLPEEQAGAFGQQSTRFFGNQHHKEPSRRCPCSHHSSRSRLRD